ncbi:MAG TPA: flagellar hook-basal body complex protein FliE [Thermoplasmatales archaeon]|nr:flagellar hook-basal body complex protein FliE [Thermoplasmatales archaeon]
MKAIAFTGLPGAGKTEAVNIAKELGIKVVSMGDEVRNETMARGFELNDSNVGRVADEMREKYGKDIWAKKCLKKIKNNEIVVIDGIRNIEEVETFKNAIRNFILIAIHASPSTRYERLMNRRRKDDSTKIEDLKKREKRELAWGIGNVIAMADIIVVNEGSLEEFREKIMEILKN